MANMDNKELKMKADVAKANLYLGTFTYDEAKEAIKPYVEAYNKKSKEIAKKYNQRPRTITVASFLR